MNALDMLKEQHSEVEELFEQCEEAEGDEKQSLFAEIADKLAIHAAIEEEHFYPACKSEETEEMLKEAVEEHLVVKRLIAELLQSSGIDERFDAQLKVLKENVLHHAKEEEEKKLFPLVKKLLDKDQLEAIGDQMTATQAELLEEGEPRNNVFQELDLPAPV
jgi:hemerythrin superfamily protein